MSASSNPTAPPMHTLHARSQDPATELFLVDARQNLVARGRQELTTSQPPGVYTLKLRAGPSTREELILLDRSMEYPVKPLEFASAVPLEATAQTHEYQQDAAVQHSRKVHVRIGSGASIYVFAREWMPENRKPVRGHHPAEGLGLYSVEGNRLVDFQSQSDVDLNPRDPWAACRVSLDPGLYRLAVRAATGERFEMSITAPPNLYTKVFLLQRESQSGRGRRPDLGRASVLMTTSADFQTDSPDSRIAEMARLALMDGRKVYSHEMDQLLSGKYQNPMLGIFGGHLLLLEAQPDLAMLRDVVHNLRRLVGDSHPDVEALALAAGLDTAQDFAVPPMLRQSWRIVVEHSKKNPRLVPPGSLAAAVATQITQQEPWLIWRRPETAKNLEALNRGFATFLGSQLKSTLVRALIRYAAGVTPALLPGIEGLVSKLNVPPATLADMVTKFVERASASAMAVSKPALKKAARKAAAKKKAAPKYRKAARKAPARKIARKAKAAAKKAAPRKRAPKKRV
jgi:hypothetical protein